MPFPAAWSAGKREKGRGNVVPELRAIGLCFPLRTESLWAEVRLLGVLGRAVQETGSWGLQLLLEPLP